LSQNVQSNIDTFCGPPGIIYFSYLAVRIEYRRKVLMTVALLQWYLRVIDKPELFYWSLEGSSYYQSLPQISRCFFTRISNLKM